MEANENLALYGRFQMVLDSPKHYLIRESRPFIRPTSGYKVGSSMVAKA